MTGGTGRPTRPRWVAAGVLVLAALVGGGTAAVVTGWQDGTPEPAPRQGFGQGVGRGQGLPAVDSADAGFAQDMAVHHQQAVEMSFLVRDGTRDEDVRRLAYDIAHTQSNQRGMLLGWLDLWGLPKVPVAGVPMAWMGPEDAATPAAGSGHPPTPHDMPGMDGMDGTDPVGKGAAHPEAGTSMTGMATDAELKRLGGTRGRAAEVLYLQLMTDHHRGGIAMARRCAERCAVPAERRLAQGMVDAQRAELDLMADLLAERGARPRA
ncbi:DUF305 domain-containing protein [Streptomyces sp. AM 2-1-1]|uniref:DUF305 domain-containing protein n=1 Tax=unclassified Streptomyces TaxID=2593676 RepID=UPI0023B9B9B4|nr:DUF305 domain-containing protein [Streptomyces sp. AM 2-1-1]WEH42153.1 DUF305 domain-containing protein [Streptomyces sp. AM 2-1-1]